MGILTAIGALTVACLFGLFFTPWVVKLAYKLGAIDRPDGHRKSQPSAVFTGGGVAVAISAVATISLVMFSSSFLSGSGLTEFAVSSILVGLLPAALVLIAVGLIDDLYGLTGIYKLIGQVFSVSILVAGGFHFDYISLFWVGFPLGNLSIPFTMFFCLGAINAFNLIDGIDGLASSVGTMIFLALGVITASQGDAFSSLVCFAFAGALVGFLRYNLPPAKIYLGDTGSMLIGLVVSAVAIHCSIKEQAAFVLLVPIAICAIPILDAVAALVRRVTTGQSVFTPDRGHLHHALLLRGWSVGKTVAFITGLTAFTCSGALASYFTNNEIYALATTAGVFIALAATKVYGHAELKLLFSHARALIRTALHRARRLDSETEKSIHLQGTRQWETIWQALLEAVPVYHLAGITLRINIPRLHESFFADWQLKNKSANAGAWQIALPLLLNGSQIGKLTLQGLTSGSQALVEMQQVLDFLEPLETEIEQIIFEVATSAEQPRLGQEVPAEQEQSDASPTEDLIRA